MGLCLKHIKAQLRRKLRGEGKRVAKHHRSQASCTLLCPLPPRLTPRPTVCRHSSSAHELSWLTPSYSIAQQSPDLPVALTGTFPAHRRMVSPNGRTLLPLARLNFVLSLRDASAERIRSCLDCATLSDRDNGRHGYIEPPPFRRAPKSRQAIFLHKFNQGCLNAFAESI